VNYLPLAPPFFFALLVLFVFVVVWLELRIVQFAYQRVGVSRRALLALLLLSFLGSYINIPVATLSEGPVLTERVVSYFGMRYVIPMIAQARATTIAVNVGGAVVPTLLSLYLIVRNRMYVHAAIATVVITVIVHLVAQPVPGLGIVEPVFVPPVAAAVTALLISRSRPMPLAYAAGSLGTLIGADLLNLDKIPSLGAPVVAIGGAGKFDGIFMTGLVAVLLTSSFERGPRQRLPASGSDA
jgi:uncharacterized membrane protein